MIIIKWISLISIVALCTHIGLIITKKYKNRVIELKEIKRALNLFETKIKFTYEPVPDIFKEISKNLKENIGNIFYVASKNMEKEIAQNAWVDALKIHNTSMNKDDIEVLKGLRKVIRENKFRWSSKSNRINTTIS